MADGATVECSGRAVYLKACRRSLTDTAPHKNMKSLTDTAPHKSMKSLTDTAPHKSMRPSIPSLQHTKGFIFGRESIR
jgi:hypothetical protein